MEKYQKFIVGLVFAIITVLFISYFGNIFVWLLLSLFITMVGSPLMNLFDKIRIKKFGFPRWLASLLTLIIIGSVFALFISIFVPLIADQVSKFQAIDIETVSEGLEKPIKEIDDFVRNTKLFNEPDFSVEDFVLSKISSILSFQSVGSLINSIGGTAWTFFLTIFSVVFISFFFLKDKERIKKSILDITPEVIKGELKIIVNSIKTLITRYLFGVILEMLCMMTLFTTGFYIVGVDFNLALLVGIIGGLLNIIPYLGPWIGAGLGVVLITIGNINLDFYSEILLLDFKVIVVVAIAQIIDNVLFQPLIYSKSIKAHPIEIYLVIIIAGSVYGVVGMMLAIPAYTILRVIAKEILFLNKTASDARQIKKKEALIENESL
ncbi:MAG: AI-2E family transporter [Bacteroidales bacterium]|jgi:predicted PurR-regulated permease PerM|nr:AI-2E family transporter [Bacteroidales bacterium]